MPRDVIRPCGSKKPGHSHHRIGLDEGERAAWVVQVNLPRLEAIHEGRRERRNIDLEAGGKGLLRRDAGTDAAMLLSRDPPMELERAAPEPLAAEGVVAKCRSPVVHEPSGIRPRWIRRRSFDVSPLVAGPRIDMHATLANPARSAMLPIRAPIFMASLLAQ